MLSLALLVVALCAGVPITGHSHHEGEEAHLGPPGHAHGLALVQFEMRLERAAPPLFLPAATDPVVVLPPPLAELEDLPACDDLVCESRAPPNTGPRAPPL
jgi:hypothetical protein